MSVRSLVNVSVIIVTSHRCVHHWLPQHLHACFLGYSPQPQLGSMQGDTSAYCLNRYNPTVLHPLEYRGTNKHNSTRGKVAVLWNRQLSVLKVIRNSGKTKPIQERIIYRYKRLFPEDIPNATDPSDLSASAYRDRPLDPCRCVCACLLWWERLRQAEGNPHLSEHISVLSDNGPFTPDPSTFHARYV